MKFNLILITLLLTVMVYCTVREQSATVDYVYDGDTITLVSKEKLRFARIDAPEMSEPEGIISRDALRKLIDGKQITYLDKGTGYYGRTIAEVYIDTINVNDWLVANGYAVYKDYN